MATTQKGEKVGTKRKNSSTGLGNNLLKCEIKPFIIALWGLQTSPQ